MPADEAPRAIGSPPLVYSIPTNHGTTIKVVCLKVAFNLILKIYVAVSHDRNFSFNGKKKFAAFGDGKIKKDRVNERVKNTRKLWISDQDSLMLIKNINRCIDLENI